MNKIQLRLIGVTALFMSLLVGCAGQPQPRAIVERYLDARMREANAKSEALDMLSKKSAEALTHTCELTEKPVEYKIISETIIESESIVETSISGAKGDMKSDTRTVFGLKQEDKAWKIYKIGDAIGFVNLETWRPTKGPVKVTTEGMAQDFRTAMIRAFENPERKKDVTVRALKTPPGKQFKDALRDMSRSGAPAAKQAIDQLRKTIETNHSER